MTSEFFQGGLIAYREIFWPEFVEYDGCIFLGFDKTTDETIYRQWLKQMNGDKRRVEAMMNHRHIVDLLPASVDKPTQNLIVEFGKIIKELWDVKLKRDFPAKSFCISFPLEESEILTDYEISFYQL
jgi:hypothetical protein